MGYFDRYKEHKDARIRPSLLWEYDKEDFDWNAMRNIVVQRVIERGFLDDYYAMLNLYGKNGVRQAITEIPYLSPKDISFVCIMFNLKKEKLRCYTRKPLRLQHGNF